MEQCLLAPAAPLERPMSENPTHPDALNPTEPAHLACACAQAGAPLLSEQVFRAMFEQAAECLAVYDVEGRIIHANDAFTRLMARVIRPEQHHMTLRERVALFEWLDAQGQPLAQEDWPVQRVLRGEVLSGVEEMVSSGRMLDGSLIYLRSSGSPLRDTSGQIVGAVFAHRDVTEQRQAQEAQAQLFNFIAHELNTPLTTMKGQTQLARRRLERGEPMSLEQLGRIEQNMKRMERLVGDLLDSARLEQERIELDLATLDLRGLCRQAAEEQMLTSERSVQLDLPNQPVLARVDALRLSQVLANLLSNALKYSPVETAVVLRLREEGGQARVEVQDRGPGIPPEVASHLFERFYRAPGIRVLHGSGVGLGLGLYLCKHLVELHGGKIGASSVEGQGSTFWFTTPLSQKSAL